MGSYGMETGAPVLNVMEKFLHLPGKSSPHHRERGNPPNPLYLEEGVVAHK